MAQKNAVALGFFDGVHIGHGALLRTASEAAKLSGLSSVALTFDTHPAQALRGGEPMLLSTPEERRELMRRFYGIETVRVLPFDKTLRETPWQVFAEEMLLGALNAGLLVCGEDFRFGRGAEGTAKLLSAFCAERGVPCRVVPQVCLDGPPVSSTRIRALLRSGDFNAALRLLGHPFLLCGTVVHGLHNGARLGFPTANLPLEARLLPPNGVYAATVEVDGREYLSVTNIGVHPTLGALSAPLAESWLPDFSGDLYGKPIRLLLHAFLRPEQHFDSTDALTEQVHRDESAVRTFFAER